MSLGAGIKVSFTRSLSSEHKRPDFMGPWVSFTQEAMADLRFMSLGAGVEVSLLQVTLQGCQVTDTLVQVDLGIAQGLLLA